MLIHFHYFHVKYHIWILIDTPTAFTCLENSASHNFTGLTPSIHFLYPINLIQGCRELMPIPAAVGLEAWNSLNRPPVHHRDTRDNHAHCQFSATN